MLFFGSPRNWWLLAANAEALSARARTERPFTDVEKEIDIVLSF